MASGFQDGVPGLAGARGAPPCRFRQGWPARRSAGINRRGPHLRRTCARLAPRPGSVVENQYCPIGKRSI